MTRFKVNWVLAKLVLQNEIVSRKWYVPVFCTLYPFLTHSMRSFHVCATTKFFKLDTPTRDLCPTAKPVCAISVVTLTGAEIVDEVAAILIPETSKAARFTSTPNQTFPTFQNLSASIGSRQCPKLSLVELECKWGVASTSTIEAKKKNEATWNCCFCCA